MATLPAQLHDETRLTPEQASIATGRTLKALSTMRTRKEGPAFERQGPQVIRYRWGDLRDWLAQQRVATAA
jgi:hypothetical protein